MKCLLISLALWLGIVGIQGTELELSETQRRGLQVALEEFHKHPPVQSAFQEIGVDSADDMVSGETGCRGWRAAALETSEFPESLTGKGPQPATLLGCASSKLRCWGKGVSCRNYLLVFLSVCMHAALLSWHLCEVGI